MSGYENQNILIESTLMYLGFNENEIKNFLGEINSQRIFRKFIVNAGKKNYKIFILYLIQRNDCETFTIAKDIDPNYALALSKAVKNDLNILCYDCKFSSKGIKVNKKIKIKI